MCINIIFHKLKLIAHILFHTPHHILSLLISPRVAVGPQQHVDAVDDPVEEAAVESLAHGVPHLRGLLHRVGPDDRLSPGHNAVGGQSFMELV